MIINYSCYKLLMQVKKCTKIIKHNFKLLIQYFLTIYHIQEVTLVLKMTKYH